MYKLFKSVTDDQIRAVMMDTYGPETEVKQISHMKGGAFNTTYYVECTSPVQKLILRIAPGNKEHLLSFEKNIMAVEPYTYELMAQAGIPCTEVVRYDGSGSIIDRPYMLISFIESIQLNDPSITSEEYKELQVELGKYLRQMHDISADTFGFPQADGSVKGSTSWGKVLIDFSREIAALCREYNLLELTVIDRFQDYFVTHSTLFDEITVPSLVHNDLWDPNVLVQRDLAGIPYIAAIIDADKVMFADREFDAILFKNDPQIMKGYGSELDNNSKAITRREAYEMLWMFAFLYIHEIQVEMHEDAAYFKEKAMESFHSLI
ncbi:phosphotransferase family protein [Paenibacillus crassostreae]|nr:aminoglycoside phosphotransferase family protein [Paenibacillus crassostreae]